MTNYFSLIDIEGRFQFMRKLYFRQIANGASAVWTRDFYYVELAHELNESEDLLDEEDAGKRANKLRIVQSCT